MGIQERQRKMRKVRVEWEEEKTYNRKEQEGMDFGRWVIESIYLSETSTTRGPLACSEDDSDAYLVLSYWPFLSISKFYLCCLELTGVYFLPSFLDQGLLESREFVLLTFVPPGAQHADYIETLKTFDTYLLMNKCELTS